MSSKVVGIVIFPEVEVLDFCGPYEVFSVTRRPADTDAAEPPFRPLVLAQTAAAVPTRGGMRVLPDFTLTDCPPLDVLVVPGGPGTRPALENEALLTWLQTQATQVETLTSVCTGSLLLGQAGLLDGLPATTHWGSLDWMADLFPQIQVVRDQHVVETGNVLTSAGISAGIDMALRVVTRYYGEAMGRATAKRMEYPYPDDNRRRVRLDSHQGTGL